MGYMFAILLRHSLLSYMHKITIHNDEIAHDDLLDCTFFQLRLYYRNRNLILKDELAEDVNGYEENQNFQPR